MFTSASRHTGSSEPRGVADRVQAGFVNLISGCYSHPSHIVLEYSNAIGCQRPSESFSHPPTCPTTTDDLGAKSSHREASPVSGCSSRCSNQAARKRPLELLVDR